MRCFNPAVLLTLDWNPRALPAGTQVENVPLRTADAAASGGALYAKGKPRTAVFLMHPREFFAFHYLVPSIVEAGFAAWAQLPRSVGLDLRLEHADLADLARRTIERFEPTADRPPHHTLTLDAPQPVFGVWDPARLDQVITNLISNATKYGAGKPIEVTILKDDSVARIVVKDHGIGIAAGDHERIFEQFERVGGDRYVTGLGLGLYISRNIVEQHGGRIRIQSAPGEGAVFTVELPLMPAGEVEVALGSAGAPGEIHFSLSCEK